jgi:hypothetical protein
MKKYFMLFVFVFVSSYSFCQKIEENTVDEFTGNIVKRTSWETLIKTHSFTVNTIMLYSISKIKDMVYLNVKMILTPDRVFSVAKDQELMMKLETGEVVKLSNLESAISCTGCGAYGFSGSGQLGVTLSYSVNAEQFTILLKNKIVKIRIYASDGYVEEEAKNKEVVKFQKALALIQ